MNAKKLSSANVIAVCIRLILQFFLTAFNLQSSSNHLSDWNEFVIKSVASYRILQELYSEVSKYF